VVKVLLSPSIFLLLSSRDASSKGGLENKKKAAELPRLPLKRYKKKAEYPYIGHSAVKKG
jgi:hypothetical protein